MCLDMLLCCSLGTLHANFSEFRILLVAFASQIWDMGKRSGTGLHTLVAPPGSSGLTASHLSLAVGVGSDSQLGGSQMVMAMHWGRQSEQGGVTGSQVALYEVTREHAGNSQLHVEQLSLLEVRTLEPPGVEHSVVQCNALVHAVHIATALPQSSQTHDSVLHVL